ncbi:alpha-glucosidase [Proteiniclasticum sp. BAD-10]|uniref:Alpha-glucosidase n=1 Tax=Proteiniclasticum sediminis TaxID=2804028 RepID=A0A941CRW7_9CLOT|nr:alpha-glucosidase [Proteiniclasticum sediminis]MBR0576231.1 alpha-glucosidase [Proteiniclasticum sediminis]
MRNFQERIIYQIWPRSFKDSNDDGIGDLNGIIEKLDYLQSLGVDTLWLSPVYATENADYGYDVTDYYQINPEYGTMEDMEELIREAKRRHMEILMDLVASHTSDRHPWFQKALADPHSPQRQYYFFRKGKSGPRGKRLPPNNWMSAFGDEAWQWDQKSQEYYLTLFTPRQCDLNWENLGVRQGIYAVMRFWLEKGIAGFRMDVINAISKATGLPDAGNGKPLQFPFDHVVSLPMSHVYLQEMRREVLDHYPEAITLGEGFLVTQEDLSAYTRPGAKELDLMFPSEIHLLGCGPLGKFDFRKFYRWEARDLKRLLEDGQTRIQGLGGWQGIALSNHDQPRQVSRFGDDKLYRRKSAKLLAMLSFTLRGTPVLFQGEEIGMTNCPLEPEEWKDYEALNAYRILQERMHLPKGMARRIVSSMSRDNARTPMQWSAENFGGFSSVKPWITVNPNFSYINVEDEEKKENSLLDFYRKLTALRQEYPALRQGSFKSLLRSHPQVMVYLREIGEQRLLVALNLSGKKTTLTFTPEFRSRKYLLGNYRPREEGDDVTFHPYEGMIFLLP